MGLSYEEAIKRLTAAVEPTGQDFDYRAFALGTITIPQAGPCTVRIQPAGQYDHDLMQFQSLLLNPVY